MKAKDIAIRLAVIGTGLMISTDATAFVSHHVQRGETLWGLAHKYQVTADDIVRFNPTVKTGLKTGQTLRIPEAADLADTPTTITAESAEAPGTIPTAKDDIPAPSSANPVRGNGPAIDIQSIDYDSGKIYTTPSARPADMGADTYVARFGDTFKSVAAKTGINEAELIRLNPLVEGSRIAEGEIIRLTAEAPHPTMRTELSTVDSIVYVVTPTDASANERNRETGVALLLPFELTQNEVSRQALLATDFYKGFLLATKDNERNIGGNLRIYAVDVTDESTPLSHTLRTLADEGVDVVVPPDDETQLAEIEQFCEENGITVFNVLNIKDEGYLTKSNVVQCNINQRKMYDKAIEALETLYADYTPVILNQAGGKDEKSGFTEELKRQYREKGKSVRELSFSDILKESDLSTLPADKKYIFIPKSGSQDVFDRISDAIATAIESDPYPERLKLFGYPDWVALRGQSEEALHRIGAVIYSRFNYEGSDSPWGDLNAKFKQWYGVPQIEVFPSQGTLGYDAGSALLRMLGGGWPDQAVGQHVTSYSGLQSVFKLEQEEDGGMINNSLYVIEFLPGTGTYTKVI